MNIVFATNNQHKLKELRDILGNRFQVVSLKEIECHDEIPETGETLEENAILKVRYVADFIKKHPSTLKHPSSRLFVFADDTGLEVEALNGAPGVHTARYADTSDHDSEANMNKLLSELNGKSNRKARFRTVIALTEIKYDDGKPNEEDNIKTFDGIVNGRIAKEKSGQAGFGYDPIFIPEGSDLTFAQLGDAIKNNISHRARATKKLAEYLTSLNP